MVTVRAITRCAIQIVAAASSVAAASASTLDPSNNGVEPVSNENSTRSGYPHPLGDADGQVRLVLVRDRQVADGIVAQRVELLFLVRNAGR